jgi:hypothetical protein
MLSLIRLVLVDIARGVPYPEYTGEPEPSSPP